MGLLGLKKVDYKDRFERGLRFQQGRLTEEELEQLKKDEEIMR
jgi:hypothetical protein